MKKKNCELHGAPLERMEVSISYGLPYFDEKLIEARDKLFPNANRTVLGGCCVGAMGSRMEVEVCQMCREAETKWRKENGREIKIGKIRI